MEALSPEQLPAWVRKAGFSLYFQERTGWKLGLQGPGGTAQQGLGSGWPARGPHDTAWPVCAVFLGVLGLSIDHVSPWTLPSREALCVGEQL